MSKNITFDQFITEVINLGGNSPQETLIEQLGAVSPQICTELLNSSLNPLEDPSRYAFSLQWLRHAWPEEGLPALDDEARAERMGRAIEVILAEQRRGKPWLAEAAKISYPYLSEICKGLKTPRINKYMAICKALGISFSDLAARAETLPPLPED